MGEAESGSSFSRDALREEDMPDGEEDLELPCPGSDEDARDASSRESLLKPGPGREGSENAIGAINRRDEVRFVKRDIGSATFNSFSMSTAPW